MAERCLSNPRLNHNQIRLAIINIRISYDRRIAIGDSAMNILSADKKITVLNLILEGCSVRTVERITGALHK